MTSKKETSRKLQGVRQIVISWKHLSKVMHYRIHINITIRRIEAHDGTRSISLYMGVDVIGHLRLEPALDNRVLVTRKMLLDEECPFYYLQRT
ncbi:hypothetical protein HNY73_021092 [Argiope bruennichi]|uniref:Uncharacterized protein n=1 Tax=Argiope bruennichi TaxID=94029 RepID=A0A8T0EBP4_ARGBR|nr:hypothetical protein HNY73_021092 [Argiope bruennichi]